MHVDLLTKGSNLLPSHYKIVGPLILDAADFGAATRRPRLFIIGYDPGRCDPIRPSDFDARTIAPSTVHAAIKDLTGAEMIGEVDGYDTWKITCRGRPTLYATSLRSSDGIFTSHRATAHTNEVTRRFTSLVPGQVDPIGRHPKLSWNGQCPIFAPVPGRREVLINPYARYIPKNQGSLLLERPPVSKVSPTTSNFIQRYGTASE